MACTVLPIASATKTPSVPAILDNPTNNFGWSRKPGCPPPVRLRHREDSFEERRPQVIRLPWTSVYCLDDANSMMKALFLALTLISPLSALTIAAAPREAEPGPAAGAALASSAEERAEKLTATMNARL